MTETTSEFVARIRSEMKARRAADRPLRTLAAKEIKARILEVLRLSVEEAERSRKYGISTDPWFSVGLMAAELRQTGKALTGEAFHKLYRKADQCAVVRSAMESLRKEKKITRAIGYFNGRECYQYQFGSEE